MENLSCLKQKRSQIKGRITRFRTFLDRLDSNTISEQDANNIQSRLDAVLPIIGTFFDIQDQIELSEVEEDSNIRTEIEDSYYEVVSFAHTLLSKYKIAHPERSALAPDSHSSRSNQSVKLPTIALPSFDGAFSKWCEFFDTFNALIHENHDLTDVQKLSYLRASLKDEPAVLVSSLQTTAQNYEIAWKTLQDRYDNKRRIINTHIENILSLPSINKDNHLEMRSLINTLETNLRCLQSLGQKVDQWSTILIPIIVKKLDFAAVKEWEVYINDKDNSYIPTLEEFIHFLTNKSNILETVELRKHAKDQSKRVTIRSGNNQKVFVNTEMMCYNCKGNHYIQNCSAFLKLKVDDRINRVKELKLCLNCIRPGHYLNDCRSSKCKYCKSRHNSLLHIAKPKNDNNQPIESSSNQNSIATSLSSTINSPVVLLATANALALGNENKSCSARFLLDSASQPNLITRELVEKLNLKSEPVSITVSGVSDKTVKVLHRVQLKLKSFQTKYQLLVTCLVVPKICDNLPSLPVDETLLDIPSTICLADPQFTIPRPIDILLGAEVFWDILTMQNIRRTNLPSLHNTKFGWIVGGPLSPPCFSQAKQISCVTLDSITEDLQTFWKLDDTPIDRSKHHLTSDELDCEKHFKLNTTRNEIGQFVVRIPFNKDPELLGDSYHIAKKRLLYLERKLNSSVSLNSMYREFMTEYKSLGHMNRVPIELEPHRFFIPHHSVVNETKTTTKLRVVFDGSCRLEQGFPVNAIQHTGPQLQKDLFTIISNFRLFKYAICADIEKMYRQVVVHPDDRKYQTILWRDNNTDEIDWYELSTVTYGLTSAPYLAIKCLFELADIFESKFPREANIIRNCFYVDDLLTGANSIDILKTLKANLTSILQTAHFNLRKWISNCQDLNSDVDAKVISLTPNLHKTLGIYWNNISDTFHYNIASIDISSVITKRTIVSNTAKLFDPLGLVAPVVVVAKLIIQSLWKLNLDWDSNIPEDIAIDWKEFISQLEKLSDISIPRYIMIPNPVRIELHAFADASEKAYGACLYVKAEDQLGNISTNLLSAKSRIAPLKTISLPRLELCAALIAAQLLDKYKSECQFVVDNQIYWSDSTIVLAWIKSEPFKFKTFVANRISEIQEITKGGFWYHIESENNPADMLSRGALPVKLKTSTLWWHGPIHLKSNDYKSFEFGDRLEPPELKSFAISAEVSDPIQVSNYSNINKLLRVAAWCLRFIHNCRSPLIKRNGFLRISELMSSKNLLARIVQQSEFATEYQCLKDRKELPRDCKILGLAPFLDEFGLIRVGGRLRNCPHINYDQKHPILLPKGCHLVKLLFEDLHRQLLHAGPKLLVSSIRQNYWPINALNSAKAIVRNCNICFRYKAKGSAQQMGNLPTDRVKMSPPFTSVGVDFAGPFNIKSKRGRGASIIKGYICLFICMTIKAVHLEVVSDLSTDAFLGSLRRFVSRRGKPADIYCDNGKTFVGAKNELGRVYAMLSESEENIYNELARDSISWHFIPPYSPHFGGLWESGVKSVKHHLKRVLLGTNLTFEEFSTLLTQIESILNSRPLCSLSNDPNDDQALTPAHFLIGRPFTSIPDLNLTDTVTNRLNRFQLIQQLMQHFWKRWRKDYLHELQQRSKWKTCSNDLQIGRMVLMKNDNAPPHLWKMGRIVELHPGSDGHVRVVSIRLPTGIVKRAIAKICIMPSS